MRHFFLLSLLFLAISTTSYAQPCTPQGDEVTYGTGNIWRGYVYNNSNLGNYRGYVTEGQPARPILTRISAATMLRMPRMVAAHKPKLLVFDINSERISRRALIHSPLVAMMVTGLVLLAVVPG